MNHGTLTDPIVRSVLEQQVARQIYRFAQANDDHDHDALCDMFTPDGSFARPTEPARPIVGREHIRAFLNGRPARRTKHFMANVVVDILSGTEAIARSYILLYAGATGETVLAGEFADELTRDETGVWLFRSRRGSLAFDPAAPAS